MTTSVSESSTNASSNASSSSTIEEDEESSSSSLSAHALASAYNESLATGQPLVDDSPHVIKRSPVTRPKRLELGGKNKITAEADGVFVLEKPKARINKLLRVDEFAHIFSFLDGMSIGPLCEVCHDWHIHTQDPLIWRVACQQYWWCEDDIKLEKKCKKYGESWKRMLIERHHVRYDGYYVLDTVYWQPGGFGFGERQARVQKVSYFRYLHFRPNGKVYYCLTNYEPDAERGISTDDKQLSLGTYKFNHESIAIKVDVGHMMAWMMLKFMRVDYLTGVHNRLEFAEFYGQGAKDRAPICFNITSTLFRFYRFRS